MQHLQEKEIDSVSAGAGKKAVDIGDGVAMTGGALTGVAAALLVSNPGGWAILGAGALGAAIWEGYWRTLR